MLVKLRLSSLWQRATGRPSQRESLAETEPPERRADLSSSPAAMSWVGEAGNSNYLEVELSERSPQGLGVSSPRPVPVDQKVWLILPGGDDYQGLVDGCQRTDHGFRVGVRFLGKQRPPSENPDLGTARLKWLDESGSLAESGVFIQNSSAGELDVLSPEPVPSPSIVLLSGYELQGLASAQTCHQEGDRFLINVALLGELHPTSEPRSA